MKKKATILKSLRTDAGAREWTKLMKKHYPTAVVVDTDTLKSYSSLSGEFSEALPSHVIIEESMAPKIAVKSNGEVAVVIKAMSKAGYIEVNDAGDVALTAKWHTDVDNLLTYALKPSFKSVDDMTLEYTGKLRNKATAFFMKSLGAIQVVLKSLEDSEALAKLGEATENDEFGHELRPNKAISDGEATGAFEGKAKAADTEDKKMSGEKVTDGKVKTATHEGDHNKGTKKSVGSKKA
jgi:hypothetical protein